MRALTDVTGENLRQWRESQGWDVPRMARELRKAARDSGEDVAAHHGLVRMIPQWERGNRVPRERYRLLYRQIFGSGLGDLSQGMALGAYVALRLAEVRSRSLPWFHYAMARPCTELGRGTGNLRAPCPGLHGMLARPSCPRSGQGVTN